MDINGDRDKKIFEFVRNVTVLTGIRKKEKMQSRKANLRYHREYMRVWRKSHPLNVEQKKRDSCRSYAGVYLRRGKIIRQPCQFCGNPNSEMHHPDYSKPLFIVWLCRACHLILHAGDRGVYHSVCAGDSGRQDLL